MGLIWYRQALWVRILLGLDRRAVVVAPRFEAALVRQGAMAVACAWVTGARLCQVRRSRCTLASKIQSANRRSAGTALVVRKAPLAASAAAVTAAPAASQRGRARARKATVAVAAQNTARGERLSTVAAPPSALITVCSWLPAGRWAR